MRDNANTEAKDQRIYTDYRRLLALQPLSHSFRLLPKWQAKSLMTGRHQSQFRGRGLNFEELKHYQVGDDIRNLDWKVTLRTGQPHVRLYSEEKDRNVVVLVDQGANMFFASTHTLKSVVAAEVASLVAWRVLREGDRIGFLIKESDNHQWFAPMRGQQHLLHLLKKLSESNQRLNAQSDTKISFSETLIQLSKRDLRQATVILLSDFLTLNETDMRTLKSIQRSNDLLTIRISDPMEHSIPEQLQWVMGDGQSQFNLEQQQITKVNQHFSRTTSEQAKKLNQLMARHNLPLLELSTDGNHLNQLKRLIGG
ncbi:DUF58 domain-containing protein [Psychromonas sp. psych-6C06]|nr:DUF58 domain-containing protein [Psychromonas sp. psych-6C06]